MVRVADRVVPGDVEGDWQELRHDGVVGDEGGQARVDL